LTASTILYWVIRRIKGECEIHIPNRNRDSYGLSTEILERVSRGGAGLVVAVDNGTNAIDEVALADRLGLPVAVVDHHQPSLALPRAKALINPLQSGCSYPFKKLSSVGLVHKLGGAILKRAHLDQAILDRFFDSTIGLVAVGTIADMVPLVDENRALVRLGLESLSRASHPGVKTLLELDDMADGAVTAEWVSYKLVPRLNAAGRIADPQLALSFLLATEAAESAALARDLNALNQKRARLVNRLWIEVSERRKEWEHLGIPVIVLNSPYRGVMGLLASRMKDTVGRPSIALASDGIRAVGSARSVRGFDVTRALTAVSSHLERFGGHEQAAGLTVSCERVEAFVQALEGHSAEQARAAGLAPSYSICGEVSGRDVIDVLPELLDKMAPFGEGNPSPLFLMRHVSVRRSERFGAGGQHVRLTCSELPAGIDNLGLGLASRTELVLKCSSIVDLLFSVERQVSRQRSGILIRIQDLRPSRG